MHHWTDPHSRGVYDAPYSLPPPPRPRESNDIPTRVRMMEEHLQSVHHDRMRIERESRDRARDLIAAIVEMRADLAPIQATMLRNAHRTELAKELASWSGLLGKLGLIVILVIGTIKGWLSPEQAKMFGGWLGLPS